MARNLNILNVTVSSKGEVAAYDFTFGHSLDITTEDRPGLNWLQRTPAPYDWHQLSWRRFLHNLDYNNGNPSTTTIYKTIVTDSVKSIKHSLLVVNSLSLGSILDPTRWRRQSICIIIILSSVSVRLSLVIRLFFVWSSTSSTSFTHPSSYMSICKLLFLFNISTTIHCLIQSRSLRFCNQIKNGKGNSMRYNACYEHLFIYIVWHSC